MPDPRGDQDIDAQFEDLYRRYYRAVVSFFVRLGFPRDDDARDLAQDVFLRVYRSMDRYRGESEWTYLETTARRVALNERRRRGTRGRSGVEVPIDAVVLADVDTLPDDRLAKKEERSTKVDRLSSALEALPQGLRECLLLRLNGLKYRQIAEILGITVDAVKSRLHETKAWLRIRLGEEPPDLEPTDEAEEDS